MPIILIQVRKPPFLKLNVNMGHTNEYGVRVQETTTLSITPYGSKLELEFASILPIRKSSVKIIIENGGLVYDQDDIRIMNLRFHFTKSSNDVLITAKCRDQETSVDLECKTERKKLETLAKIIGDYTLTMMKSTRN